MLFELGESGIELEPAFGIGARLQQHAERLRAAPGIARFGVLRFEQLGGLGAGLGQRDEAIEQGHRALDVRHGLEQRALRRSSACAGLER